MGTRVAPVTNLKNTDGIRHSVNKNVMLLTLSESGV